MSEMLLQSPDLWMTEKHLDTTALGFRIKNILFSQKSAFQHVCVVDTEALGLMLVNDGMIMLSERDEFIYHEMITAVPLFSHKNPKSVLIIGGGDGGTAREVFRHKGIEKCVMVEIDEMVVDACKKFIPSVACELENPKLDLRIEDGVKYVADTKDTFDVVLIDSTDPVGPAAPLFSEAFYQNLSLKLNPGGIVVSQAESPFYDAEIQKGLLKIKHSVFKNLHVFNFTNMTYPGGYWSFSFASQDTTPFENFSDQKVEQSEIDFKYYNKEIHKAAFALPSFMKEKLKDYLSDC